MELSEKCVGESVAKGKQGKKRQKVDNVLPIFFIGNQIIKSFFS